MQIQDKVDIERTTGHVHEDLTLNRNPLEDEVSPNRSERGVAALARSPSMTVGTMSPSKPDRGRLRLSQAE